ncbi:hypothetical protein TUM20985_53980 [Mycobacterium antarcticum]|uniref:hypothetical protein n=1 Tax=Mycolicibacterium sp. TUM20985 TaxID=3023370 RepID=UPI0025731054|nr:hypothetical protein [Mycolicibacterium sp. TUM20985]BDX34851.1 hypothetical protein TUM20985_53980 [Mycolicibacterium sp. TUM20985]
MTKLTSTTLVAFAAATVGVGLLFSSVSVAAPPASAAPPDTAMSVMPLSSQWRACDGTDLRWVRAVGYVRGTAHMGVDSGSIVTTVDMATATPNTHYDVRVIQVPRSPMGCTAGAPGVIVGGLDTDATGAGTTTVRGPVESGATGAWVMVERPSGSSQTPAEFYSSEFVKTF